MRWKEERLKNEKWYGRVKRKKKVAEKSGKNGVVGVRVNLSAAIIDRLQRTV